MIILVLVSEFKKKYIYVKHYNYYRVTQKQSCMDDRE